MLSSRQTQPFSLPALELVQFEGGKVDAYQRKKKRHNWLMWVIILSFVVVMLFTFVTENGFLVFSSLTQLQQEDVTDVTNVTDDVLRGGLCVSHSVEIGDPSLQCEITAAGGSGKCSDLDWNQPLARLGETPPNNYDQAFYTQHTETYNQYWLKIKPSSANVHSLKGDSKNIHNTDADIPENNDRTVTVTIPTNKPMPRGGFPFVFSFQFTSTTTGQSVGYWQETIGGIPELDLHGEQLKDDYDYGLYSLMAMYRNIVDAGYAFVTISEFMWDVNFLYDCDDNSIESSCWRNGQNPDADAMREFFDLLRSKRLISNDDENLAKFLNYDKMAVLGYSSGAELVSRMINEFPSMTTRHYAYPFPNISAAILISGGSYHCYEYYTYNDPPPDFLPCARPDMMCCPRGKTEDNYDSGNYTNHPPTLLLQGEIDRWAPDEASANYFDVLSRRGDPVYKVIGPILSDDNTGRHGSYTCQIPAVLGFLSTHIP